MGPFSELGPLDVQLLERDEIFARKSGLLTHSALEALKHETFDFYEWFLLNIKARSGDNISFPLASEVAADVTSEIMTAIAGQLSPTVLGSDYRDLRVAVEYGVRLASMSGNIDNSAIQQLTENYPSHDFIIDIHEARTLFRSVDEAGDNLYRLLTFIGNFVYREHEKGLVVSLTSMMEESGVDDDDDPNESAENASVDDSAAPDCSGVDESKQGGASIAGGSSSERGRVEDHKRRRRKSDPDEDGG